MPLDNQMTDCASASRTLSGGTVSFMQCLMSLRGRVRRSRDDSSGRKAELGCAAAWNVCHCESRRAGKALPV